MNEGFDFGEALAWLKAGKLAGVADGHPGQRLERGAMMTDRERLAPASLLLLALGALGLAGILCQGCRTPPPGTPGTGQRIVNCATQAVADMWPDAMAKVGSCLAGTGATGCLISLIAPLGEFTEDVVDCLVRDRGAAYAHAAQVNPHDTVSVRGADNARKYLIERNVVFSQ